MRDRKGERHAVVTERPLLSQTPKRKEELYMKVRGRKIGTDGANTHKEKKRQLRRGGLLGGEEEKESSCSTVFSKANWDELPTGSLTLVTRH